MTEVQTKAGVTRVEELIRKDITGPRFTITPTRLTVKVPPAYSQAEAEHLFQRGQKMARVYDELGYELSVRGDLDTSSAIKGVSLKAAKAKGYFLTFSYAGELLNHSKGEASAA